MAVADITGKRVQARFYTDPVHGPVCERKIGPEAGADTLIERLTDEHVRLYPVDFARFQASRASLRVVGIPLHRLGLEDELVRLWNAHGVMDVETFATITDTQIHQYMPGNPEAGIELRDRARLMVPEGRRTPLNREAIAGRPGPASREEAAAEIEALRQQLAASEAEKRDLAEQIDVLTAPVGMVADEPEDVAGEVAPEGTGEGQVRRGPGRPRKAA